MSNIKPSTHGIVVDHKESGTRYAVSDRNYNPNIHRKVRDLRPGETVVGYKPRRKDGLMASQDTQASGAGSPGAAGTQEDDPSDPQRDTQTEGAAPAATKGK